MKKWLASLLWFGLVTVVCFSLTTSVVSAEEGGSGGTKVELGTGKRKHVDVDFQRVVFPHREHQQRLMEDFNNDKEKACKYCHHKKRKGRDPRACRRCHAGRRVKSKGGASHGNKPFLTKRLRVGKPLRMKDAFHALCRGCHQDLREKDIDIAAQDKRAPVNCEGCHVAR